MIARALIDAAALRLHGRVRRTLFLASAHLGIVPEPGGTVALAAALFPPDLPDTVICTALGGNVDPGTFTAALRRFPV